MRKIVSIAAAAALMISTSSVAFADAAASEGALPAVAPHAAQTDTVTVPGFGTLTSSQATLFFALLGLGVAVAVAFAASSASSTVSTN